MLFVSRFLVTVSALALASAAHAQTFADDASTDAGGAVEELVVTGSTLRSQEAVRNRRESVAVVDTLTQDDTGDLADETLAEALIRAPGVSSMQTLYGEREAAYVSVRGSSGAPAARRRASVRRPWRPAVGHMRRPRQASG